jgi:hypothetical protein
MTIGMYRSVNGVARKLTKRYRDVNGVAREITKRYRDVNGVARLTFHSGDSSVLFDASNGGDNTIVTGGWETLATFQKTDASVSVTDDYILFNLPYSLTWGALSGTTVNPIDITNYSKMHVEGTFERDKNIYSLGIKIGMKNSDSESDWQSMDDFAYSDFSTLSGSFSLTATLTLTGEQYPVIAVCENSGYAIVDIKITKVWFE